MKIDKIFDYINKSFLELKKVNWLSKEETFNLVLEVIIFSIVFVIIYGSFDSFLVRLLLFLR